MTERGIKMKWHIPARNTIRNARISCTDMPVYADDRVQAELQ